MNKSRLEKPFSYKFDMREISRAGGIITNINHGWLLVSGIAYYHTDEQDEDKRFEVDIDSIKCEGQEILPVIKHMCKGDLKQYEHLYNATIGHAEYVHLHQPDYSKGAFESLAAITSPMNAVAPAFPPTNTYPSKIDPAIPASLFLGHRGLLKEVDRCQTADEVQVLYNDNRTRIEANIELKKAFKDRVSALLKANAA